MRSFTSIISVVAVAAISAVSAYTTPVGSPLGNPIYTPSLQELVPAGTPFEITWNPTTSGTVTLVLLSGPSTNAVPLYAIVEKIPNSGKYSWTPSTALVPDVTHYGIQLIDDATGQYQYSTQFGISNPAYAAASSSAVVSSAPVYTSLPAYTSSAPVYTSSAPVYVSSAPAYVSPASITKTSTLTTCTVSASKTSVAPYPIYTPWAPSNVTNSSTTAAPTPAPYTGAASGNAIQLGLALFAGAVGVFVAVL